MGRFLPHVLCGLAAFFGLGPLYAQCSLGPMPTRPGGTFSDEGEAFDRCNSDNAAAVYRNNFNDTYRELPVQCIKLGNAFYPSFTRQQLDAQCAPLGPESSPITAFNPYAFTESCATRAIKNFSWEGRQHTGVCDGGCELAFSGLKTCAWSGPPNARVFACAAEGIPTGSTCIGDGLGDGDPPPSDPGDPGDPDDPTDPDDPPEDPDPEDPDPEDPDPEDPDPEDPDPEDPDPEQPDPRDPGTGEQLGPKLDAIAQAVLGLGPRIDQVRAAIEQTRASVDGSRADANADADRFVSAIDGVRAAIAAQGDGNGEDDGPVDLSPLTPGDDGGDLPSRDAIIEEGDASALVSQLDTDGFGLTRACPAMSWQQSYDLGWASFDFGQASQLVCWALAILGWMIALGGLIQASFILSQVGTR